MSRQILEAMFTVTDWKSEDLAYIECPGKAMHSGKNAKKDCRVNLDGAPTIHCLHNSCSGVIEEANYKFRRAIWDNNPGPKREYTVEEKAKIKKDLEEKKKEHAWQDFAIANLDKILKKYHWPLADVFHESPFMTDDSGSDSLLFASKMYKPEDVIWNGDTKDTGNESFKDNFKTVSDWMKTGFKGNFTCAATFKPGTFARKNENVVSRPYLVVESDILTLDQSCSLYRWLRDFMELKAIVYSGGKSAHAWYKFPSNEIYKRLEFILPEMKCDWHLFTPSQPVRMPGIMRGEKMQCLYWFNP